ncbi:Ribosomal RNA small subunit methyltransferase D [Chlamydia avium]|uniref:RNA methyltransferase, RsmD family n=2 Tax=Chlamydia avium TaxID=1457141 RepID=W8JNC4_9CHLA|nr:16S rRNA (guanine(966)-N(2))-methyltransferase RsmD [Chlamydia avium]AHK63784.1 RNA methyltransferase, RsmD family [Chlamydia avium 10DC88]EPP36541.1 RNA methyltransferase, RsmD family [Chlamydia psittaci 10_743_SC13]EPP38874.1 RNA methyltransferase, RsmD family [Chlamydia avium]VVT43365.1 Ribosomal RNA small subunit methyltransferase D [Chlamydia avium]
MKILSGKYKGKSLKSISTSSIRPTCGLVKEAVFNICAACIENAKFLDLFAGAGAIGLEALSRGASSVTFVDVSSYAVQLIRANCQLVDPKLPITIVKQEACAAIQKLLKKGEVFDIIYIDPPYDISNKYLMNILRAILEGHLLAKKGLIFLENASTSPILIDGLILNRRRKLGGTFLSEYVKDSIDS